MELAACHPAGTYNFEMAHRFFINLCTSALNHVWCVAHFRFTYQNCMYNKSAGCKYMD